MCWDKKLFANAANLQQVINDFGWLVLKGSVDPRVTINGQCSCDVFWTEIFFKALNRH